MTHTTMSLALWMAVALVTGGGALTSTFRAFPAAEAQESGQVQIRNVEVRLSDHGFVLLLSAEGKVIPIFVDATVAGSIQGALTGHRLKRPLSHDLMRSILEGFGGRVTQTVITLKDGIYYGALTVAMKDSTKIFDSRSSDAIALAIHFKAPIMVGRELLDSAGRHMPDSKTQTL
jgi:bifunctional DNase/RNase